MSSLAGAPGRGWARRPRTIPDALLAVLIMWGSLVLTAACSGQDVEDPGTPEPEEHAAQAPSAPPPGEPWFPHPSESLPDAKVLAARAAEALTNYPAGWSPASARQLLPGAKIEPAVLEALVDPNTRSTGRVVYPQLVGAGGDGAAVTVLFEQTLRRSSGEEESQRRVMDVRLRHDEGVWWLEAIPSVGEFPPTLAAALPPLSAAALAVLEHPRIHLPHTARDDIERGRVEEELIGLMLRIAERHEIHILTLSGGRPGLVFGTDRPSQHSVGRAVDIYAVDGDPVILQRETGTPAYRLVTWLFELGTPEVGSPWALDGFGGRSFTDVVHQDHIHVGVGR